MNADRFIGPHPLIRGPRRGWIFSFRLPAFFGETSIRASFGASYGVYGAPRVFLDLREAGETCSKHRVVRLMRQANLRALHGYRTRRWAAGRPSVLIPNLLKRQFTATQPNTAWVTDVTYIRTWQAGCTSPSSWISLPAES